MFELSLKEKFKRIFQLSKVTYDEPGQSQEQECLFVEIETAKTTVKDGHQIARVQGKCTVFANADKLPFGYFAQKIQAANVADTKDFMFFEIEENSGRYQNIVERSFAFIYFFNSQHNPATGNITSITIE